MKLACDLQDCPTNAKTDNALQKQLHLTSNPIKMSKARATARIRAQKFTINIEHLLSFRERLMNLMKSG